jgi:hypothetical protein
MLTLKKLANSKKYNLFLKQLFRNFRLLHFRQSLGGLATKIIAIYIDAFLNFRDLFQNAIKNTLM